MTGYLFGHERISLVIPSISSFYPLTYPAVYLFISHHIPSYPKISNELRWYPNWCPTTSHFVSIYFSIHILLLIQWNPSNYPSVPISTNMDLLTPWYPAIILLDYFIRIQLVRLAPACSGCIALRKQLCLFFNTSNDRCWQLAYRGLGGWGRRRSMTTPGPAATTPGP